MAKRLRGILQHIRNCRSVSRLLAEHDSENLRNLFWYDMRLSEAVSWRGIARVIRYALLNREQDEIAGNYGLLSLYRADPPPLPPERPNPPVWNCRTLATKAWFDEPSETRESLEKNAEVIIAEFRQIESEVGGHPDNDSLTPRGRWTGLHLFGAGGKHEALCERVPNTTRVVEGLPLCNNFGFVMFSGAEPGTHIAPHCGSSNLRQRIHLGISIPEPDAARIRVGTEWRDWSEGRTIAFDDSYEHEVVHEGKLDRIILSVDVWHPSLSEGDIAVLSHEVFSSFGYVADG